MAVTKIQKDLLKAAEDTSWNPSHVKKGRFVNWLEGVRDWAVSRNRFWGAPLPIWVNESDESDFIVVSSVAELKELAGLKSDIKDLHRPDIDKVKITRDGKTYQRVEEVFDCWFESGSMPYAQDHYPFENQEGFAQRFPADFVVEAIEQVHLWFYTLHVLATALRSEPAYKNVIADGLILAADGKKLSKRLKNYPPIGQLLDDFGADTARFFILSSPLMDGVDTRLDESVLRDIYRNVFMTFWNTYSFFKTYSDIDKWQAPDSLAEPHSENVLDKWLLSRLNETIEEVTKYSDNYQLAKAVRPLISLIDDTSNWYVRRSRRRFWKSESDKDKNHAYQTLHYTLVRICQLFAPWAPFLPDHMWRELTRSTSLPRSVHLSDWPQPQNVDANLLKEMKKVRDYINEGLSLRAEAGIKVRQPLASAQVPKLHGGYKEIICDELNVKRVDWGEQVVLDTVITPELKREGMMRDIIRRTQNARKQSGLQVDDRIILKLSSTDGELALAIKEHIKTITSETLAKAADEDQAEWLYEEKVAIEDAELHIKLKKASTK